MGRERDCSRPFYFPCGCDLTARMSPRHGGSPGATPGSRTNFHYLSRAPACAAESPKLSLPGAAPGRLAIFHSWGRGRQVMHLPCKQAHMGAVPIDSTISLRGTRLKHRGRSHKPFQAGVIPAPATIYSGGDPTAGL